MRVQFVSLESDINPEHDMVDVLLHLEDGRTFALLVATPNYIYWCMDNDYYFGEPPLFVRRLTRDAVEAAIQALLQEPRWLSIYGTLQSEE